MAWLSDENGAMYQVDDPVYNTYAEELAATQAATAGATSNYYDASVNGGEGGQVYVYDNGQTVTTNNIGQPTSATLPTSQYEATAPDMFRPIAGAPTSTIIGGTKNPFGDITGGFQVGIETPTYVGQNYQMSYDPFGNPTTQRIQPELSNFDKVMRAGTIAAAAAPWAYGAATGMAGASSTGIPAATGMNALDAYMASAGLTPGVFEGSAFTLPASLAAASQIPSWLSSLASPLSKLGINSLSSALRQGATSGLAPSLGKLATGQTGMGMEVPGIVRTNQNPFFNTQQAPIQTPQKTEMSQIADLLRQGQSWQT